MGPTAFDDRSAWTPPPSSPAHALDRLATAIQDPTRRRILLALHDERRPRTVDDMASLAGVHRSVAFDHLEHLASVGLLSKSKRRGLVGKPAALYHLCDFPLEVHYPPRQITMLAGLLARSLGALGAVGRRRARQSGVELGSQLAAGRSATVAEALRPLEALGAVYSVEGDRVTARNCLFEEACRQAPEVVCGLHGGIIEGLLRSTGFEVTVASRPTGSPGCAYLLVEDRRRRASEVDG